MALKSVPLIMDKFFKKDKQTSARLEKNRVRAALEVMLSEHLTDYEAVLTFEAKSNALDAVIELIEDPSLTDRFDFYQLDETLFQARLKEFDIF